MIQNADMRLESGTCNVCSAPCSSCMHLNQAFMGSKAEEFSDENCRLGEANNYSVDESDGSSHRSRACERLKHAISETSNMPSVNSGHDSLSENAESTRALSSKCQDSKCLEGLDDNTSCISRTGNTNLVSDSHQRNADRINISCRSPSVSHLGAEGSGTGPSVDISGLSEILSSKDADIPENLSECCVGNVDSSPTKEVAPVVVSCEESLADKDSLINGSTAKVSVKIYPKSEPDTKNDVGDVKEDHKCTVHDGMHEKLGEPVKPPDIHETQSEEESDESDIVEHDVKVCDICGDAGREDLLAICSRCSDGAEHTYCMREMLEKVPERDWLCEECKSAQETENQRLDVEEKKYHKVSPTSRISSKRPPESTEVSKSAKRQAFESSTGSPKASSPKRIFQLSRESSFKNLEKGKLKPDHQTLIHNHPGGDDIELTRSLSTGPRSQTTKSTLLKSNSFNNFNSKPRVKLVDEVVLQKKKGSTEHTSKNMETPARMISKSMSFKSLNLGRSSASESKVKMISSKSGTTQDLKGSRLAKESGASDRKIPSRIDRSVICSTMATSVVSTSKGDQKLTPRGETTKISAVNNNREFKANQDGRLSSSKSINNFSRKSLEPLVSSARTSTSGDETQLDGLPQSQETANQVDIAKDSSSDRVRSGFSTASKSSFCHKCKDFGHPTECCTIGNAQEFAVEVSATAPSSSKEEMHKDNRLKAAIQAALLRRPSIYKKKEVPDRSDEFPTSGTNLNCEDTSQDLVLETNTPKNMISSVENNVKQEILENTIFQTSSSSDLKQLSFGPTDFCSQPRKSESAGPASAKPVVMDIPNRALAVSSVPSKISAFPEYEYIWQGVFQVHRNGKPKDLYTGIQAHLSTCASRKVLEVVNKFLPEISLNEVSRLSTWPSQFHQGRAKEDNIALYFFAKDIESYERHYKGLLDHMIRNDLAFKGFFDGVELLIFPSNQLPEDSQRWNRLFFLWGVFRGQRMNHSESAKKICIPSLNAMPIENDFPTAVMTLSDTRCSPTRMDEESIACGKVCSALLPSTSLDQGDAMKDGQYRESKPPEGMVISVSTSTRTVETKIDYNISVKQENVLSSGIPSDANNEIGTARNIKENKISESTNNDDDQQRPKRKRIEDDLNMTVEETFQEDLTAKGVNFQSTNDKKVQHIDVSDTVTQASAVSYQKVPWSEVNGKLDDEESSSKKPKSGFSEIYGCCSSGGKESFNGSIANDLGSFSSAEDKGWKEACDEKIIHEDLGAMERTFFPVDTHHKNDSQLLLNSVSLKGPQKYEDQLRVGFPNLELALGGKTKPPPQKGMLPFLAGSVDKKNNQEKPPYVLAEQQEDDSVAASLSLSLSFPSSNKEHSKPVPKAEHLPDGHHVNTSFLLFGRFTDQ